MKLADIATAEDFESWELQYKRWQDAFVRALLRIGAVLGPINIIISYVTTPDVPLLVLAGYLVVYAAVVMAAFGRVSYRIRAGVMLFALYGAAAVNLIYSGIASNAAIWLLALVVSAAMLWSFRAGWIATGAGVLLISIMALLVLSGYHRLPDPHAPALLLGHWTGAALDLLLLAATTLFGLRHLWSGFRRSRQDAQALLNTLLYERSQLEARVAERTQALRASEETFRALAENNPLSISRHDWQYRYLYANPASARRANRTPAEVIGRTSRELHGDLEVIAHREQALQQVFDTGQPHHSEYEVQGRIYETWAAPEFDPAGKVISVITTTLEITGHKRAEEALRQRTEELSAANAALARAARMKDEFLASMSHELRTPLTGILAFAQALQKQVYGPLTEKQLKSLRSIEDSGKHLLDLINDILDLSKIEAGMMELEIGLVSAEEICQASLRLIKQMAQAKKQDVAYHLNPLDLRLLADNRRLKQMLVNLLSNAVKFTPEGGSLGLEVEGDGRQKAVRFIVWDKGVGIAAEDMPRVFQSFVQLDSRLSRRYAGTGLGLALVRRLAELHGGGVAAESEVGKGSRFTIALPWSLPPWIDPANRLAQGGAPRSAGRNHPVRFVKLTQVGRPRLLLAEDTEMTIAALSDYLEAEGYEVIVARSGSEAIQKAREVRPDLILVDVQMPGMDGLETMQRIRQESVLAATPMIALTALAVSGERERCLAAGANDYLTKPVNLEGLAQAIRGKLPAPEEGE